MTRFIFLSLVFIGILSQASYAQTQVFSKQPSALQRPQWIKEIIEQGDNSITLQNNRIYEVQNGSVLERIDYQNTFDFINFYDFENKMIFHRAGRIGESVFVTPFGSVDTNRINRIKEYGCYAIQNARERDKVDFRNKYCGL